MIDHKNNKKEYDIFSRFHFYKYVFMMKFMNNQQFSFKQSRKEQIFKAIYMDDLYKWSLWMDIFF